MSEEVMSCVEPARGPLVSTPSGEPDTAQLQEKEEARMALARVGHEAPYFEAAAYVDGGFKNVKLSDYRGKWVVLCFYPGDFTFV